jgi:phenylacetate-coenzyme A ligase PaaK-like adenylate-forming protein
MRTWPGAGRAALDAWRAQREGPGGLARRREARLRALVAQARTSSPFYRRRYRGLPVVGVALGDLPPVAKPELMAEFDDWVTDPRVTRADVEAFVADPSRVGAHYRGGAFACTSSGTTGRPGLFVHDARAVGVYEALAVVRSYPAWLTTRQWGHLVPRGVRAAAIVGTGGHFAGAAWYERGRRASRAFAGAMRVFSVHRPLPELVSALNGYRPTILAGYPSALALLAGEQDAGRLRLEPVLATTSGESLTGDVRERVEAAFACPVRDSYASSEGMFLAFECSRRWQHVNSDWFVLEPVDEHLRPVPAGERSHTVLLTNLANGLQPVIRYDLGDSILARPDPCPCGNAMPAIRVAGRSDDPLRLRAADGRSVTVLPLAIGTIIDRVAGVRRAQLAQVGSASIRVRLDAEPDAPTHDVWGEVLAGLRGFLDDQGLGHVELVRAQEAPRLAPGGKFRRVVVERTGVGP